MRHILIVTHGFPPANNMAAHRNFIRAKGFDEQGYRVSVVTRAWKPGQAGQSPADVSPHEIIREKLFSNTTVYRVPFGPDHLVDLNPLQKMVLGLTRKKRQGLVAKLIDSLAFFVCPLDYAFRLDVRPDELARLLPSAPDFVLASGDPWSCFDVGQKLSAFFKAKQISEYRDPWNYVDDKFRIEGFNTYNDNWVSRLKRAYSVVRERRLNRKADLVIAASEPFLENALAMTGASQGMVVTNGFDRAEIAAAPVEQYGRFTLSYIGTIYSQQRADIFFRALQQFIDNCQIDPGNIRVRMIGSNLSHGFDKTMRHIVACRHHEQVVEYSDRLDKRASLGVQKSSDVLLFFAHDGSEGIIPGKFFEYIAVGTPILLVPSDRGVLESLVRETRTGAVCNTVEETAAFLESAYLAWKKSGNVPYDSDQGAVEQYSYQQITKRLINRLEAL